jgi:signal transduction histidine kinase
MTELAFATSDQRAGSAWLLAANTAEQRMELLVGLISRINHDLRTPLNTILGWTHLLQQGSIDAGRFKHVADVLARNAREQTVLLEEFVDDGRAVLGVLKLETEPVAIDDAIAHVIDRAQPLLGLHGVSLTQRVDATRCTVQGDPSRVQRLLYRLLCAVIRRAREGATIELVAHAAGKACTVSIAAAAAAADWSEAALLELRVSAHVAALFDGTLDVDADRGRAAIGLRLPTGGT